MGSMAAARGAFLASPCHTGTSTCLGPSLHWKCTLHASLPFLERALTLTLTLAPTFNGSGGHAHREPTAEPGSSPPPVHSHSQDASSVPLCTPHRQHGSAPTEWPIHSYLDPRMDCKVMGMIMGIRIYTVAAPGSA